MSKVRFIHLSDTHIGPTKDFSLYSVKPYPCTEKIIDCINHLPDKPDFIIHTGDVAATIPDDASFKNAKELFGKLRYPIYYVTGNHDRSSFITQYLQMSDRIPLVSDKGKNAYRFDFGGYRFIILDGRGADTMDPHGSLSDDQFQAFEKEFIDGALPILVFIHFPPILLDSIWLDQNMLLLEGDRLHKMFQKAGNRLHGVFFGHIHRGMQIMKEEVCYSSVGSTFVQFQWLPSQKEPVFESTGCSYFNLVTLENGQVTIKEYSVPNGNKVFVKTRGELGL